MRQGLSVLAFLITLLRIGKGGNAYADIPTQLMDRASVSRALGSRTGDTYIGSLLLNWVANKSIMGLCQCAQTG